MVLPPLLLLALQCGSKAEMITEKLSLSRGRITAPANEGHVYTALAGNGWATEHSTQIMVAVLIHRVDGDRVGLGSLSLLC